VISVAGGSARLRYMGATPDKFSRTGDEVLERMCGDGLIVGDGPLLRDNPNDRRPVTNDGLARIDSTIGMAHQADAVTWWKQTRRFYGAKSPEVRQFMLHSDNYIVQPRSINRFEGAVRAGLLAVSPNLHDAKEVTVTTDVKELDTATHEKLKALCAKGD
jgi:filamentous hemagglutinin